jgi:two-component system response regulator YesN
LYKLLIVDDEPIIRKGIKKLINLNDLKITKVLEASDGLEAIEIINIEIPHIILLDINMPNMDGLTLAKEVKEKYPTTKIAIITGYDYFDYALSAIKAGVDDYILKPVSKNDVTLILKKIVEKISAENSVNKALNSIKNLNDMEGSQNINYKKLIVEKINKNYSDTEFSLVKLSKMINLSSGYLSSLFKQIFGISFQEYIFNFRLEKAKILLLTTNLKMYEISEKVGFDDPNYFSTSFRKKFKISPNKFKISPNKFKIKHKR